MGDQWEDKTGKVNYGYKNEHHLILEKIPPDSVVELSKEIALPQHRAIYDKAIKASTFEESIAIIAAELDIALDGLYDAEDLCEMLVHALQNVKNVGSQPWKLGHGLVSAELVEVEGEVRLERAEDVL